jgi:1,2-diacylglycerol 3-beta-galactosyltransferase
VTHTALLHVPLTTFVYSPLFVNSVCSVDKCFVPSDALYQVAKKRKLQDSQIVQYGLPIRKGFWGEGKGSTVDQELKTKLRQQLGLNTKDPVVLVVGGGDGMGGIVGIAKALGRELEKDAGAAQLIVVCGSNKEAKQSLEKNQWGSHVNVNICGFITNMEEYMKASDVLVTKAGPGTIAEASICGLPCMMFSFL